MLVSRNNTLANNTANSNNYSGIVLADYSNNNTLANNTASNNYYGIKLDEYSSNNMFTNNTASSNYYGIYLCDFFCNYNTFMNNTANSNNFSGIYMWDSSNNTLANNTANSNVKYGISLLFTSNSTITSNTANSNGDYGIFVEHAGGSNMLANNTANLNNRGIRLSSLSDSTITSNTANSNNFSGINLYDSSNSTLTSNIANSNGDCGIRLEDSSDNLIYNNYFNNTNNTYDDGNNQWDSASKGNYYSDYTGTDSNNDGIGDTPYPIPGGSSVDRYPLMAPWDTTPTTGLVHNINKGTDYTTIQAAIDDANPGDEIHVDSGTYYENVDVYKRITLIGDGADVVTVRAADAGDHVFEVGADWVNISGFTVMGATDVWKAGIYLGNDVDHCSNSENNASNNWYGIRLYYSSNNTLQSNTANSNNDCGIFLYSSSNNTLINNTANSNGIIGVGVGIRLYYSSNNTLQSNTANSNGGIGVYLEYSSNNTLQRNTANSNIHGIVLHSSSNNNTLIDNTASNNDSSIRLWSSSNNTLYHNNLIDNKYYNAYDSCTNQWDSGFEGNYYSDYTGTDSDGDGIGDTPYPILGGSNVDRYPLMNPWTASPLYGKIAFASFRDGNQEVYVMNANGTCDPINLTNRPDADDGDPTWSPDGTQIAFSSNRSGNWKTYIMNADDGSDQVCLLEDVYDAWGPAWSPDGTKIAVAVMINPSDDFEIYTVDVQSNVLIQVTDNISTDSHPCWSPDSHKIAFTSNRDNNQEIYVADLLTGTKTRLTYNSSNDDYPEWSPDGSTIAFVSGRGGNPEIYSMVITSKVITRLTYDDSIDKHAQWSPDGQKIIFVSNRSGDMDVYVMETDGTGVTCLVDWEGNETHPTWSPGLGTNIPPTTNPISVTNTESLTPTISWTYGDADGDPQMSYEVEVWTGPEGSGINEWSPDRVSSQFTSVIYAGNSLVSGKTYYVRVRAFDGVNWGGWSETSWIPFENLHSEIMNKLSDKSYYDRINLMNPDDSTNSAIIAMITAGADDDYYALYDQSFGLADLRANSLKMALDLVREGRSEKAEKYIQDADWYGAKSNEVYQDSIDLFIDVMDDGIFVAGQVKAWSRYISDVGLTLYCPPAAHVFDYLYLGTDFATDYYIDGLDSAVANSMISLTTEYMFTDARYTDLNSKTLEEITKNAVGRETFPLIQEAIKSPQGQREAARIVKEAAFKAGVTLTDESISDIIKKFSEISAEMLTDFSYEEINLNSPGELRVYDSQGDITGIVNGKIIEEIPYSTYDETNERVIIPFAKDTYRYEVVGTGVGTYGLDVFSTKDGNVRTFSLTEIPISPKSTHQYTMGVDYSNKDIITASIDSDGDGIFEETINMMLPTASFNCSPEKPVIEQNLTFDASLSNGSIVSYKWEFGDGIESYGKIVNHSYSSDGIYTINLTVKDGNNALDIKQKMIFVSANFYNITFFPPITTMDQFNLTDGSTFPIKFTARNSTTDELIFDDTVNVTITNSTGHLITYFTNGTGTDSVRINSTEEQYSVDFNTIDYPELIIGETYTIQVTFGNINSMRGYAIAHFTLIDCTPPASISNLHPIPGPTWLNFTWTNPPDPDFNNTELYLNGTFLRNIPAPQNYYNITGLLPNTSYELGTRTVDINGNMNRTWVNDTASTLPASGTTLNLYTGWNLISLPLMPEDSSITSLLSSINGNYSIVWEYNASDTSDHWKKYDPDVPFGNDLTNMEPGKGYWIMMTSDNTLPISGTMPESTDLDLKTGWNLVCFNSLDSKPIAEALSSINGNYSIVWTYDASDTTDHWKKYDPGVPFGNDLINVEPGRGYWIMMTSEGILKI